MTMSMGRLKGFFSGVFGLPNHHVDKLDSFTNTGIFLYMASSSLTSTSLTYTKSYLVPEPSSTGKITTIFQSQPIVILTGNLVKQQLRICLKAYEDGKLSSHLVGLVLAAS